MSYWWDDPKEHGVTMSDDIEEPPEARTLSWRTIVIVVLVEALVIGAIVFAGTHDAFGAL